MNLDLLTIILIVAFLASAIGIVLVGLWLYRHSKTSRMEGRLSDFMQASTSRNETESQVTSRPFFIQEDVSKFRQWLNNNLGGLSSDQLRLKLSSAYWEITDTEFILVRILVTLLGFLVGWLLPGNILGGIFLAAILFLIPPFLLDRSIGQRQVKFHTQLLDVLILIKGAVQAGYSLMQALDLSTKEVEKPASEEFGRVLREVRFGIPLEQALYNLAERMESDDLQIVITAIIINAQVGGNLSTVLEATISTIRDRMHLFGEIRSLTSYARYVGTFLTLLPFIAGFGIFLMDHSYFDTVKTSLFTQIVMVMAFIGILLGNYWIRRIVRVRV